MNFIEKNSFEIENYCKIQVFLRMTLIFCDTIDEFWTQNRSAFVPSHDRSIFGPAQSQMSKNWCFLLRSALSSYLSSSLYDTDCQMTLWVRRLCCGWATFLTPDWSSYRRQISFKMSTTAVEEPEMVRPGESTRRVRNPTGDSTMTMADNANNWFPSVTEW